MYCSNEGIYLPDLLYVESVQQKQGYYFAIISPIIKGAEA